MDGVVTRESNGGHDGCYTYERSMVMYYGNSNGNESLR